MAFTFPFSTAKMILLVIVVLSFACKNSLATIDEISLPSELQECLNSYNRRTNLGNAIGARIYWKCVQRAAAQRRGPTNSNLTMEELMYVESLLPPPEVFMGLGTVFHRNSKPRVRKEYRMMTDQERNNYHRAINTLKRLPLGDKNRFDVISNIHTGIVIPLAHDGPNFVGWHRIYLLVYENALRQIIPSVTVPYWAGDLDQVLEDPTRSLIWCEKFLGDGIGAVSYGPFANWMTPSGPLVRNIGVDGELWTTEGVRNILKQSRHSQILNPGGEEDNNLESQHDLNHRYVGGGDGQIADLEASSQDPVFFNIHTYVDYIWELFRQKQLTLGIDPASDYPMEYEDELQAPNAPIQFATLRNRDGYNNGLASIVFYEPKPECSRRKPSCGSPYLVCNTKVNPPRCESRLTSQIRDSEERQNATENDDATCNSDAIQNRFTCDGKSDIREWVYVPVEVICRRPPEKRRYDSYPVFQGSIYTQGDIYSPETYGLDNYLDTDRVKTYKRCNSELKTNTGKVFVESNGLNYHGRYSEFAVMDTRLAIANSISYVAVKTPESGSVDVILSAHDACGRVCKPFCRAGDSQNVEFRPCNGALQITSRSPKLYGRNYGENVLSLWGLPLQGTTCPNLVANQVRIKFFCDFKSDWPWQGTPSSSTNRNQWSSPQNFVVPPFSPLSPHLLPGNLRNQFLGWFSQNNNVLRP